MTDSLECQICRQSKRRLKVLSCFHSFCQQCLEKFLKKQKVKTELDCPTCRSKTLLLDGGVAGLKDNFFVESLEDTLDEYFGNTAAKANGDKLAFLAKRKVDNLKSAEQQAQAQQAEMEKNVTETIEKIKRKAEQTRKELIALVNQQEAELLSDVNELSQARNKEFSTAIKDIKKATVALEEDIKIMTLGGEVSSRLKLLLQTELTEITGDLPAKAFIDFEEDEAADMVEPRLGEVKTMVFEARFTTLGTTGRLGPTSLGTHYRGQDHEGLVQLKDGIQYFTVPDTGKYRVEAAGEVLKILVGQEGAETDSGFFCVGGGGGTFVTKTDNTPLIVAGGAGGGYKIYHVRNLHSDGTRSTVGQYSSGGRSHFEGGSGGKGATKGDKDNVGGGGGGLLTDGASGKVHFGGTDGSNGGEGGKAFVNGGVGGRGVLYNAEGGFGGGGGSYGRGDSTRCDGCFFVSEDHPLDVVH
ncbi:keratin, type I cytoskeletal 9-like [Branchiostoma floridae]|uniref:Keratin, type I cytoskeletal 9-like n=1 Tax=Branchiostoma floridae TaxID=7739 RepID=A0A9J7N5W3_BRAFL|nr:keratin, type I cytoskeletal 9-like [Branchiostoma floridae]